MPLIQKNLDGEPFGCAENPDNWIFFLKVSYSGSLEREKILQQAVLGCIFVYVQIYRVSIKSFPEYKRLLQENYVE